MTTICLGEALERKEALARKAAAEVLALLPPRTGLMDRCLLVYLGGFNLAAWIASSPLCADSVLAITEAKISIDASAVLTTPGTSGSPAPAAAAACRARLSETLKEFSATAPPAALHPVKDLKLQDLAAVEACHAHARLVAAVPALPSSVAPRLRAWHALLDAPCTPSSASRSLNTV